MSEPTTIDRPVLRARPEDGHKGTFGRVLIVGGSCANGARMIGAPALAARAAFRLGAGLVRLLVPRPVLNAALVVEPSATGSALAVDRSGAIVPHEASEAFDAACAEADAVVIGPGLGRGDGPRALVLRALQQERVPVVVDADGLHAMGEIPALQRDARAAFVVTPHPGEFRVLARAFGIANALDGADSRARGAEALARKLGCVAVLKGRGTVVTDGHRIAVCDRGHACLATAGTGDVLAGMIGALAALDAASGAGFAVLWQRACDAVWVHAVAGERWAEHHGAAGLLARELADQAMDVANAVRAASAGGAG